MRLLGNLLAATLLLAPLAGCLEWGLERVPGVAPAPLPPGDALFAALVFACGMKPDVHYVAVYANGTGFVLTRRAAWYAPQPPGDGRLSTTAAAQVMADVTNATGGAIYAEPPGNVTRALVKRLDPQAMEELRRAVTYADFPHLNATYQGSDIVDGCEYHQAAWVTDRYLAVQSQEQTPVGLTAFRDELLHHVGDWE